MRFFLGFLMFLNLVFGLYNMFWGFVAYSTNHPKTHFFAIAVLIHIVAYHFCSVSYERELEKEKNQDSDEM